MGYSTQAFITFLEGVLSFISPCMLPMFPIYLSYLAGEAENKSRAKTMVRAVGFVIGFSLVFSILGLFAGTLGAWLGHYRKQVNVVAGLIVILFGLSFLGLVRLPGGGLKRAYKVEGFFSAFVFGTVYSLALTPCVGAFLGSALVLASTQGEAFKGLFLLIFYSLGMSIPFLLCALLIDRVKKGFDFIKRHYNIINRISGSFLIIMGMVILLRK
jgi:cytochrome c-type biogenesis protein